MGICYDYEFGIPTWLALALSGVDVCRAIVPLGSGIVVRTSSS
jgi:hypothetical protein